MDPQEPEKMAAPESVRSKMQAAWNNMRYSKNIFQTKASFSEKSPVWLLGIPYSSKKQREPSLDTSKNTSNTSMNTSLNTSNTQKHPTTEIKAFQADFESRIWFTYRKDLPVFCGSQGLTSDAGWGCMLRSAQMLMAQALLLHKLGRQWRLRLSRDTNNPQSSSYKNKEDEVHRSIIRLFSDTDTSSPFSIHNLVRIGNTLGKTAGNWFGPATAAFLLQMAWLNNSQIHERDSMLEDLAVYVSQDCTVYKEDVINICSGGQTCNLEQAGFDMMTSEHLDYSYSEEVTVDSESWCIEKQHKIEQADSDPWKSVLILIPIRVGGDKLNPIYADCLRNLLTLPCCLGWIGGKPSHSLYFIGYQDEHLLHLDPHRIHPCVDTEDPEFAVNTFNCHNPRKLLISKMDPSSCLGFYLRTREEFEVWCSEIESYVTPKINKTSPNTSTSRRCEETLSYPLFTIQHKNTEVRSSEGFTSLEIASHHGATEWVNMEMTGGAECSGLNPEENKETHSEDFVFL